MKVKELMVQLSKLNPEMDLVLQKDSEGNGYEDARGIDPNCFWMGDDIYSTYWSADEADIDKDEWAKILKNVVKVGVIYP